MARVLLRELEPYRPLFVEEPVLAERAEHYPRLAESTTGRVGPRSDAQHHGYSSSLPTTPEDQGLLRM